MSEKNPGWSSDYLSLRSEMMSSIEKQDQLFIVLLTAFGAMVALSGTDTVYDVTACALWLALLFVILVLQSKTLQYRDSVYRLGTYLYSKEEEAWFEGYRWEHEFSEFCRADSDLSKFESSLSRIYDISRVVKNASFFGLALLSFVFLVYNASDIKSGIIVFLVLSLGMIMLFISAFFYFAIQKGDWKKRVFLQKWKRTLDNDESTENPSC